jgi:hypothetical protein
MEFTTDLPSRASAAPMVSAGVTRQRVRCAGASLDVAQRIGSLLISMARGWPDEPYMEE